MDHPFSKFTNLYSLSKTLRFELKPVGNTQKMLEDNGVFEKDHLRQIAYKNTKPYFDRLHREFVNESLADVKLEGLIEYNEALKIHKSSKDKDTTKKIIDKHRLRLREQIVSYFDNTGIKWATGTYKDIGIKKKDKDILFEEQVFQILKARYGEERETKVINEETGELVSIFDGWKGFTGYFDKFFATRKNFYEVKSKATAIATRAIDQNLDRFINNLIDFDAISSKIDIREVEDYFGMKASEVLSLGFYNNCLLQKGIDTYNDFLGGKTLESGEKIKGVNEVINKYRQDHKQEKAPFLRKLDKQILSEKDKEEYFKVIETDEECLQILVDFQTHAKQKIEVLKVLVRRLADGEFNTELDKIYLSKESLNTITYKWTMNTDLFQDSIYTVLKDLKIMKPKGKNDEEYSFPDFISLSVIQHALVAVNRNDKFWGEKYYKNTEKGEGFIELATPIWEGFIRILEYEFENNFLKFDKASQDIKNILDSETSAIHKSKTIIKEFADSALWTYQMGKYFALEKKRLWDSSHELGDFYGLPKIGYYEGFYVDAYEQIVKPYNDIRNYLTKKPYSEDKWKLNFENPTLADGWDKNKESNNSAVILRKNDVYFLAIMAKGNSKIFDNRNSFLMDVQNGEYYEKMIYKYLPDAAKMIPKCSTQLKDVVLHFAKSDKDIIIDSKSFKDPLTISKRIFELNNVRYNKQSITETTEDEKNGVKKFQKEYYKLSNNYKEYKDALTDWIDFCKLFLSSYDSTKDFDISIFKESEKYDSLDEFYSDIDRISYSLTFQSISEDYIDNKNQSGALYLFKIYNQDFANGKTGKKNMHTVYFEELFSEGNSKNGFLFKLNGQAEIFYRPKSIEVVEEDRNLKHKVVSKKRYTENKTFLHAPITLNRIAPNPFKFNTEVNNFLANNPDINIIGIDRGEKHLAYYSVVSQKGKIIESGSLNTINGVDYAGKLEERAGNRERARQDWQDVENIKDLKRGYISQIVRKLADLAIEHNAIIVMEDLNMRFKQIRGGIEKSIYQQLEKALIEKLNFLVNKGETDLSQAGHLLKAYQLTAPFESFKDMGKQTGIIFYTQASYTSKIDPLTGWRPNLYLKYSNADNSRKDILKFNNIKFSKNRFEFTYDLKNFVSSKEYPHKTEWTLCSNVERFRWERKLNNNKGGYLHYPDLTSDFKNLFEEFGIDSNNDIIIQIESLNVNGNEKFFKNFIYLFNLICQIRNTQQDKEGDDNDFILSPVEPFFDSRKSSMFGENLPGNGDDNGAYNIARKGIIILDKISDYYKKNGSTEKIAWNDLNISHVDWDNFAAR